MQLELELRPPERRPTASLLIASSPEAAWQEGAAGWLARVAANAWQSELPAVVLVPTRGQAQALKARVLAAGHSLLGVEVLTPQHLRAFLAPGTGIIPPPREHLRFLLALAAEERLQNSALSEPERLAAISVRRTPEHLLRLLEQLSAAGSDFSAVDLPAFRPLVQEFKKQLAANEFLLAPEADRAALAQAEAHPPRLGDLLIAGFHGAHWPLWHLLRAAVATAKNATVLLQFPRDEAAGLDQSWIGAWEEIHGEAKPIALANESEPVVRTTHFLAGLDTQEQAAAIAGATQRFLANDSCTRLGIVFPAGGALSRRVAAALTRAGIPHYDTLGQMVPGLFEAADFWAWMELQRTPRLHALRRFLTSLPANHPLFEKTTRGQILRGLAKTFSQLALDHLPVLAAAASPEIEHALRPLDFLPPRATVAEFLAATASAFAALQWDERRTEILRQSDWAARVRPVISRTLFLKWLEEVAVSFRVTRDHTGSHPYARVHLLTPAQAEEQTWSHLILGGMNEAAWPATTRGDFLPVAQVDALNQSVQKLNRAATREGRQGEGHVALREGKTIFLGAAQQRQLALAQFSSLLASVTHGLALTVSVVQEATPERISNPGELFSRLYHETHGSALSQGDLRALREQTRQWLASSAFPLLPVPEISPSIVQTATAYHARRKLAPSDEYDFALREPPGEIEPMRVSEVEALLLSPALVWLRRYLGVEGAEDSTFAWNASLGLWTHEWLARIFPAKENFGAIPPPNEFPELIRQAAAQKRAQVHELCQRVGRVVPDWWESGWENALSLAQVLARTLGTATTWKWAVPEWTLSGEPVHFGKDRALLLRGRADLLLARTEMLPTSLHLPELWVIDFKTGNKKSLASKRQGSPEQQAKRFVRRFLNRESVQLALYAHAAHALGAEDVCVSLLSPIVNEAEPQLRLTELAPLEPALRELAHMQATGIFGMKGDLRSAFSFTADYPLATLAVDREIVDERWELTHKNLTSEDEPWF